MDHQMVHNFHLGFIAGRKVDGFCQKRYELTGHPNVFLFGVPNEEAFKEVKTFLSETMQLEYFEWDDPDTLPGMDDHGMNGIVTQPITLAMKNRIRQKYKRWLEANNCAKSPIEVKELPEEGKTA